MPYTEEEKAHLLYDRLENELRGLQFDNSAEVLSAVEMAKTRALAQAVSAGIIEEGEYGLDVRIQEKVQDKERYWTHSIYVFRSDEPPPSPPAPKVAQAP